MTYDDFRQDHSKKWRNIFLKTCLIVTLFIFFVELLIMYYFYIYGELTDLVSYALVRVVLPSSINLIGDHVCCFIVKSPKVGMKGKNCAAIWNVFIVCAVVSIFHNYFNFLLVATSIPFFMCAIFANRKLFNGLLIGTLFVSIISTVVLWNDDFGGTFVYKLTTIICYFVFNVICYVLGKSLVKSQEREIDFILEGSRRQNELIQELKIDPLTQLYNRAALDESISSSISRFNDGFGHPVIVLIDLDHFKLVNDTYGHSDGDKVLMGLSDVIRKNMGGTRNAFRFGGEEFILMYDTENPQEVYDKVMKIKDEFSRTAWDFAPGKKISFSAGIAGYSAGMSEESWFNAADKAMYKSKHNGRDLISFAD